MIDTAQTVNETMMVLVREEANNDHWVVHLHGGPGGEISAAALNFIDDRINEVYFQQRGASYSFLGSSTSSGPDYSSFSNITSFSILKAMLMDLKAIILFIKSRNPNAKIVLYGESWGVYYGLLYYLFSESNALGEGDGKVFGYDWG